MDDLYCGPYEVAFQPGSVNASVDIILINDEDIECDETFTAQIIIGEGYSSRAGFRLGQTSSASIIVKDNEGNIICNFTICIM